MKCRWCGAEITLIQRWNTNPHHGNRDPTQADSIPCEINFNEGRHYRESFVEIEENVFASVFRHRCPAEQQPLPERKKPIRQVFDGDRTKFPKLGKKRKNYKKQAEMKF